MSPHIVRAPDLAQLVLTAEVPNLEAHVAVRHLLDVTPNRRIGLNDVAKVPVLGTTCARQHTRKILKARDRKGIKRAEAHSL